MYGTRRRQAAQESIYNLIPQPAPAQQKQNRYKSKYPAETPPTASTFGRSTANTILTTNIQGDYEVDTQNHRWKNSGANFGTSDEHYSDPNNYLKKNTKETLAEPSSFSYNNNRKPAVVTKEEKPVMGRRSIGKNFVKENALNAIMAEPKASAPDQPRYMEKPDFGKVPKYLQNVNQDIAAEKEYITQCLDAEQQMYQQQQPQMTLVPEAERQKLLTQLKSKWEDVNKKYQNMTHITTLDTIGKVRRKESYESQLQKLEKSIEKLKKPFVFVQDQGYGGYY